MRIILSWRQRRKSRHRKCILPSCYLPESRVYIFLWRFPPFFLRGREEDSISPGMGMVLTWVYINKTLLNNPCLHYFPQYVYLPTFTIPRSPPTFSFVLSLLHILSPFVKIVYKLPKYKCFSSMKASAHVKMKILRQIKLICLFPANLSFVSLIHRPKA